MTISPLRLIISMADIMAPYVHPRAMFPLPLQQLVRRAGGLRRICSDMVRRFGIGVAEFRVGLLKAQSSVEAQASEAHTHCQEQAPRHGFASSSET